MHSAKWNVNFILTYTVYNSIILLHSGFIVKLNAVKKKKILFSDNHLLTLGLNVMGHLNFLNQNISVNISPNTIPLP